MSGTERPEPSADTGPTAGKQPSCRALVAVAAPTQWAHHPISGPSPDPTFVTQLLATDEQLGQQGHNLFGARTPDALSVYRIRQRHTTGVGLLTRQII
ncbi:MAG: hypothetical protein ACREDC_15005 [Bradyrhizobium sp.]